MSIFSKVTEQDLNNIRKLAEQQKEKRAIKIKRRILKQTHDIKLAESLSPITEKFEYVNKSIQELGDVNRKSQPKTTQLAIERTPTTHQPNENTPTTHQTKEDIPTTHQPIENIEGTIYDVEIENTLNTKSDNTGYIKTYHDPQRGWMINNHPNRIMRGTKVEIN